MKSLWSNRLALIGTVITIIGICAVGACAGEGEKTLPDTPRLFQDDTFNFSRDSSGRLSMQKTPDTSRLPFAEENEEDEIGTYPQFGAGFGVAAYYVGFGSINAAYNAIGSALRRKGFFNVPLIDYHAPNIFLFTFACRVLPRVLLEMETGTSFGATVGYLSLAFNATYRFPVFAHSGVYPFFRVGAGYYYYSINQQYFIDSSDANSALLNDSTHGGSFGCLVGTGIEYNLTSAFSFELFANYMLVPIIQSTADEGGEFEQNLSGILWGARLKFFFQ